MTGGGLIQLVAIGEQDLFLTQEPVMTYFKAVYRQHTNFSMETIRETFKNGSGFGKSLECVISRNADLVTHLTLNVKLGSLNRDLNNMLSKYANNPHTTNKDKIDKDGNIINHKCMCMCCKRQEHVVYGWCNAIGFALIKSCWIEIGGIEIEKHYGMWMYIWAELTSRGEKSKLYAQMVGAVVPSEFTPYTFDDELELYVPFNFWFCRTIGLALPLISLQYHDVKLHVDVRCFEELWVSSKHTNLRPVEPCIDMTLLIEYVYLDMYERRDFAQKSHVYLIEQLQYNSCPITSSQTNIDMTLNHPVKEIVWVLQNHGAIIKPGGIYPCSSYPIGNDWFNFTPYLNRTTDKVSETFNNAVLQFNGTDRFRTMPASYFRQYQNFYYHTRGPYNNNIYTYSFGLDPEAYYPTGQMNMSREQKVNLFIDSNKIKNKCDYIIHYFARNYNVLIFNSGLAGLLFID